MVPRETGAKTGATREKNVTVLKISALPFAFAIALICFGSGGTVGLIINAKANSRANRVVMFCAFHREKYKPILDKKSNFGLVRGYGVRFLIYFTICMGLLKAISEIHKSLCCIFGILKCQIQNDGATIKF